MPRTGVSIEGVHSLILGVFYAFLGFYKRTRFISGESEPGHTVIEPTSQFLYHIDEFLLALFFALTCVESGLFLFCWCSGWHVLAITTTTRTLTPVMRRSRNTESF